MDLTARLGDLDAIKITIPPGVTGALPLTVRHNGEASNSITVNVR